ncbi:MAG: NYN domain-containing protein, partial [Thermodesulfobacteriota bacterium]
TRSGAGAAEPRARATRHRSPRMIVILFRHGPAGTRRPGAHDEARRLMGEKADEVIKRLLAKGDEEILVVTSDREIATFAVRRGKTAIASTAFDERLERSTAGSLPAESNGKDDTDEDDDRPGMKRKGPSRRLSKQQRAALARIRKL